MRVNRRELAWWSFLMSSAHGAGLMVVPVLVGAGAAEHAHAEGLGTAVEALAALTVHVGAMLAVMALVALLVYERLGVGVLHRAWMNTEQAWAATFVVAGTVTLFS
jgi:hypothetical protein